jgi:microcystin-dependent protein
LGWLLCDGRPLPTTIFNLLFQVIGYTYGGSGETFNLPNMTGRVIGSQGTIVDAAHTHVFPSGTVTGEVDHKLTIYEMPAHNHDYATGSIGANTTANGTTSTNGDHIHGITDPGHSHVYFNQPNTTHPAVSLTTQDVADNVNVNQNTDPSTTGITINTAGAHAHNIASNGGDEYHNNMQPTVFYGNTFVYCGIPTATNWTTAWPFPVPQVNPPLI